MDKHRCCICGADRKRRGTKRARPIFFQIPYGHSAGKQRDAWLKLLGDSIKKYPGSMPHICSKHFHSGKPAFYRDIGNIDWVPSLNLNGLERKDSSYSGILDHNYSAPPNTSSVELGISSNHVPSNELTHSQLQLKQYDIKCCVGICGKVKGPDTVLFKFPQVENYPLLNQPAVIRRREAWLKAVGWGNNPWTLYICSDHFQGKKPAPLVCENHVDWKPTLLLERETAMDGMDEEIDPLNFVEVTLNNGIKLEPPSESPDILEVPVVSPTPPCCDSAVKLQIVTAELDETKAQLTKNSMDLKDALVELKALRHQLSESYLKEKQSHKEMFIDQLRGNDKLTKFYTGLNSWLIFMTVYNAAYKQNVDARCVLSKQQELLMALMRLRLNLLISDLAHRFNVSSSRASSCCQSWMDLIFYQLPAANITGPGPAQLMPNSEISVEEKLRKNLKRFYLILAENAITNDMYLEDKLGFSFIYKATYVCDYLMKMNSDRTESPSPILLQ